MKPQPSTSRLSASCGRTKNWLLAANRQKMGEKSTKYAANVLQRIKKIHRDRFSETLFTTPWYRMFYFCSKLCYLVLVKHVEWWSDAAFVLQIPELWFMPCGNVDWTLLRQSLTEHSGTTVYLHNSQLASKSLNNRTHRTRLASHLLLLVKICFYLFYHKKR